MIKENEIQLKIEEVELYFQRYSSTKAISDLERAYEKSTELRILLGTHIKEVKQI